MKFFQRFFFVISVITLVFGCNEEKHELRYNLEVNKEYKLETTLKQKIIQKVLGGEKITETSLNFITSFKVDSIRENGNYLALIRFQNIYLEMDMPTGSVRYESIPNAIFPDSTSISGILSSLTQKNYDVEITPKGEVLNVVGFESITNVDSVNFSLFEGLTKNNIIHFLTNAFGANAFKSNWSLVSSYFPLSKVAVGDNWRNIVDLKTGFVSRLENSWQLTSYNKDTLKLHGNSEIKTLEKDAFIQGSGLDMKYQLSGSQQSDISVEPSTGWIINAVISQKLDGKIKINNSFNVVGDMIIPIRFETEIKVNRVK